MEAKSTTEQQRPLSAVPTSTREQPKGRRPQSAAVSQPRVDVQNLGGSSANGRPATAPLSTGETTRKVLRLNIHDIVGQSGGQRPTGKGLIKGLEDQVRKTVEQKRVEFDRIHYKLTQKQKQLRELKLVLADLAKDGQALGLHEYPDPEERLQPVSSISTRPVFSKNTRIHEMEETLEAKNTEIAEVMHMCKVYDHMHKRLRAEQVEEARRNRVLKQQLHKERLKLAELCREELSATEALVSAQQTLESLKQGIDVELRLWKNELADRQHFAVQKQKFEDYYVAQLQRQRKLEAEVQGDLHQIEEEELKTKSAASMMTAKHIEAKLSMSLENTLNEEKRYEAAFTQIGIKLSELDPAEVIKTCLAQDEIKKDLLRKRLSETQRMETLKSQLEEAQAALQRTMFGSERTTNRVLSEKEKGLNVVEKALEAERGEYAFMAAVVRPVKIGIKNLASKVLGMEVTLNNVEEIQWVLMRMQDKLRKLMQSSLLVNANATGVAAAAGAAGASAGGTAVGGGGVGGGVGASGLSLSSSQPLHVSAVAAIDALEVTAVSDGQGGRKLQASASATKDGWKRGVPELLVSPYNVRVTARRDSYAADLPGLSEDAQAANAAAAAALGMSPSQQSAARGGSGDMGRGGGRNGFQLSRRGNNGSGGRGLGRGGGGRGLGRGGRRQEETAATMLAKVRAEESSSDDETGPVVERSAIKKAASRLQREHSHANRRRKQSSRPTSRLGGFGGGGSGSGSGSSSVEDESSRYVVGGKSDAEFKRMMAATGGGNGGGGGSAALNALRHGVASTGPAKTHKKMTLLPSKHQQQQQHMTLQQQQSRQSPSRQYSGRQLQRGSSGGNDTTPDAGGAAARAKRRAGRSPNASASGRRSRPAFSDSER